MTDHTNTKQCTESTCHFCEKKALYTCPRCNEPYCSSKCYKSQEHIQCSENFYKGMVEEQLKGSTASEDSKQKMCEILQRMRDESYEEEQDDEGLDSDDDEDIAQRMKDIDLNDCDAVWSKLTQVEQQEFLDLIKDGRTTDFIPPWKAWWDSDSFVTELKDEASKCIPTFMEICPPVVECPPLSHVMKGEPSPCVPFNILNVLTAYAWTVRLFNGDHQESCIDATEAVLTLSPVLSAKTNYSSADVALKTAQLEAHNYPWLSESDEFSASVQEDVRKIVRGPNTSFRTHYVAAALSDLHSLFVSCKRSLTKKRKDPPSGAFSSCLKSPDVPKHFAVPDLVKSSTKKIEFFLSYLKENSDNLTI